MRIELMAAALFLFPSLAAAAPHAGHDAAIFHAVRLETGIGRSDGDEVASFDLDGWIGGDDNKLWLKGNGEIREGAIEKVEAWALYSRNVATFWDAQIGLRQDIEAGGHSYLAAGLMGLSPYFFETEAHIFIRDDGIFQLRARFERDLLFTNRLIAQPYFEANASSGADAEEGIGKGLVNAAFGLQTRYEFSREFAPYVEISYERKFGRTANFARTRGEGPGIAAVLFGVRWLF